MREGVKHLESNVSEKNPFDETATVAAEELKTLPADQAKVVADWWAKHYMKAGHKRLGRLMVAISKGKPI
jgi:hypothetical protein